MKYLAILYAVIITFPAIGQANLTTLQVNNEHIQILTDAALANSEQLKQTQFRQQMAEENKKLANNQWLGTFSVGGNLNEISIKQFNDTDGTIPNFYPRYNFGVRVPLSLFGDIKGKKKIIEQEQLIIESEAEVFRRAITQEVKRLYFNYLESKQAFNYKKAIEQFMAADQNNLEQQFTEGEITLQEYNQSRTDFFNFKIQIIDTENAYFHARNELESFINQSLSSLGID